jgi:hypothetical protein
LFAGFHRNTLHELVYSAQNNGYEAPAVSVIADHIYSKRIHEMAFSQVPHDLLHLIFDDGSLASLTYERQQEVVGHARHDLAGGAVRSVCVIPEDGADVLYTLVERTIDGTLRRYIERQHEPFEYGGDKDAWFLDCALKYEGPATTIITGLGHLEGQTVAVYGWETINDPAMFVAAPTEERYTVTDGNIVLARPVSFAVIGLPFTGEVETLPHMIDAPDGSTFGRASRVDGVILSLMNSRALALQAAGESADDMPVEDVLLRGFSDNMDEYTPLYTGEITTPIDATWRSGGRVKIISTEPHPATIRSLTLMVDREPGLSRQQGG